LLQVFPKADRAVKQAEEEEEEAHDGLAAEAACLEIGLRTRTVAERGEEYSTNV
jgi:hypothetical protein